MKKHTKIFRTIFVSALLVCAIAAVGIPALADDASASTLAIDRTNVAYDAETQLLIELSGAATEGRTAGIAVWKIGAESTDAPEYYNFTQEEFEGVSFYRTEGISAQNMSAEFYVCAAEKDESDNYYLIGEPKLYGIYSYVNDRLDDEDVTEKQMALYKNLVLYGNSAELAGVGLETAEGATVRRPIILLDGGYSVDNGRTLAFADETGNALVRANAVNADGKYFCYWLSEDGTQDYNRVTTVTADNTKNTVYTAVYGEASESAWAGSASFNSYDVGSLDIIPDNATITGSDPYYIGVETTHLSNLVTVKGFAQVTSATDPTIIAQSDLSIKEENGIKYLSFDKVIKQYATIKFSNLNPKSEEIIELDFRMNNTDWIGGDYYFYFSDGTNSGDTWLYFDYSTSGGLYIYDRRLSTSKYGRYAGTFERGEIITLSAELTSDGVQIKANGKLLTTTDENGETIDTFKFSNASTDATKAYSTGMWQAPNTGCLWNIDFLGVNFVDTDMIPAE